MESLSKAAYGNWVMLSPTGEIMCRCDNKRATWYLKRNLAVQLPGDPPTIQLTFTPGGLGNAGDEFYTGTRANVCVVCGTDQDLTKHHIVPTMYRVYLPHEYKAWSSHDVAVICVQDHKTYENEAWKLKLAIAGEMGMPFTNGCTYDAARDGVTKKLRALSHALIKESKIPEARKEEIRATINQMIGHEATKEELLEMAKLTINVEKEETHGKQVVDRIIADGKVDEFIRRWRKHFIDVANPQHMPKGWSIDKVAKSNSRAIQ